MLELAIKTFGSLIISLGLSLLFGNKIINFLRKKQGKGQPIRNDGPKSHLAKKGTPTMGGVMILFSLFISLFCFVDIFNPYILILTFVAVSFAGIGFMDDYYKIKKRNSAGISGKLRLLLETIVATITVGSISYFTNGATDLVLPFGTFDVGYSYYVLGGFVIVGSANAVNITDGLDGLSTATSISATIVFLILAFIVGDSVISTKLTLPYLQNSSELFIFCGALIGSLLGFLWFNLSPAKVWMGDLGSLSLGAIFGTMAVMTKSEFVWAIAGGLFVIEILSVIIQVVYFRRTGGKRFFKMAPIHHHFELSGWKEKKVVFRFWLFSVILGIIGLLTIFI
ncbi:MAG: phospho-N-acetylmuramoyl-pentapeptide-transferase [Alphaproteobacteria bacterium]